MSSIQEFVSFARQMGRTEIRPGVPWSFLAQLAGSKDSQGFLGSLDRATCPTGGGGPEVAHDDTWTENERFWRNLGAVCALAEVGEGEEPAPALAFAMRAFTGWWGLPVWELPADPTVFPPDYVAAIRNARVDEIDSVFAAARPHWSTKLAEGVWALVLRVQPGGSAPAGTIGSISQPGTGRMLEAAPFSVGWWVDHGDEDAITISIFAYLFPQTQPGPAPAGTAGFVVGSHWDSAAPGGVIVAPAQDLVPALRAGALHLASAFEVRGETYAVCVRLAALKAPSVEATWLQDGIYFEHFPGNRVGRDQDVADVDIHSLPYDAYQAILRSREAASAPASVPAQAPAFQQAYVAYSADLAQALEDIAGANPGPEAFEAVLAERVQVYLAALQGPDDEPMRAEAGRTELEADLHHFAGRWGAEAMSPLLREAYSGGLPRVSAVWEWAAPRQGAAPEDVVAFFARRYDWCTAADLEAYFPGEGSTVFHALADSSDRMALGKTPNGMWGIAPHDTYLTGDLYAKLARLDEDPGDLPGWVTRKEEQKALLREAIGEWSIGQIHPTPRSGFVPLECLQAFVNEKLSEKYANNEPAVTLSVTSGRLYARTHGTLLARNSEEPAEPQLRWLLYFLGYWNRETMVVDPDEVGIAESYIVESGTDLRGKVALEKDFEREFEDWISASEEWRPVVENIYNHAFRGKKPKKYDESPLPLLRLTGGRRPHLHQNAGARRALEPTGNLLAWSVGLGKTLGGICSLAMRRQLGMGRKPMVVVPNNVVFNWFREIRLWLPTYRIGIIGWSYVAGHAVQDTKSTKIAKWERYAEGDYDVLLVPYSSFWDDVAVRDATAAALLAEEPWFPRAVGADLENRRLTERKVAHAEGVLDQKLGRKADLKLGSSLVSWKQRLEEPVHGLLAAVQRAAEGKPHPSDTQDPFRPRIGGREEEEEVWAVDWDRDALLAYAKARGVEIYDDTNVEISPAYTPEEWIDQTYIDVALAAQASGKAQVVEVGKGKGKTATKASILRILGVLFASAPPGDSGSRPKEPLVYWEDIGCDYLVIDEAHNYKNTWYAQPRLGQAAIEFMGAVKRIGGGSSVDGGRAWDMWLKCRYLLSTPGRVLPLTATPIKNSPLELYSLLSLLSKRVWVDKGVTSSEEYVDRYAELVVEDIPTMDFGFESKLAMKEFREATLEELRGLLLYHIDRLTVDDLLAMAARDGRVVNIPQRNTQQVFVPMDDIQNSVYDSLGELMENNGSDIMQAIKQEDEEDEEGEGDTPNKVPPQILRSLVLDIGGKAAIDPRLLTQDLADLAIKLDKDVELADQLANWEHGGRKGAAPKGRRLSPMNRLVTRIRHLFLRQIGAAEFPAKYGQFVLPKYWSLAKHIEQAGGGCGHIVFSDFNDTHEGIRDAISRVAGVPYERVAIMTGELKTDQRQAIADAFNGRDAEVAEDGAVLRATEEPQYDVVVGNSQVMAEGQNLQKRTCAIHHLTYTWEPATLEQRNGRAVRQGNRYSLVDVRYYIAGNDPQDPTQAPNPSYDYFKIQKTVGKGDWQKTLFSPDARTVGNPLAGASISLADIQYMLIARTDPEKAQSIRAEREAEAAARQRNQRIASVGRRFRDLVGLYNVIRRATGETKVVQQARATRDEHDLGLIIRSSPGDFPATIWSALAMAKDRTVLLDMNSGFYLGEGEYLCVRSALPSDGPFYSSPTKMIVSSINLKNNVVIVRRFGTPFRRVTVTLAQLLSDKPIQALERLDLATCGGWDPVLDREGILTDHRLGISAIPKMDPDVVRTLGQDIWQTLVAAHNTYIDTGFLPVVSRENPEEIYLVPSWRAGESTLKPFYETHDLMLPANIEPSTRTRIIHALKTDQIRLITGLEYGTNRMKLAPFNTYDKPQLEEFALHWLFTKAKGSGIGQAVFDAMLKARAAHQRSGGSVEETLAFIG